MQKQRLFTMPKLHFTLLLFCLAALLWPDEMHAQRHYERLAQLDVQHYAFSLTLNDTSEEIRGIALVKIQFRQAVSAFYLDLKNKQRTGIGMAVSAVLLDNNPLKWQHQNDRLTIQLPQLARLDTTYTFRIDYQGIPADGLIIDQNKFGHRTFFGDNWPNRAHHWLPTVDHPSDKASVEFIVTAPVQWQVVANGILLEKTNLGNGLTLTHWAETVPLPTKVMVIGVAPFAVRLAGEVQGIPVTSWVFPENRLEGFYDYEPALDILDWFITHVGPYPYRKLANVQSKTRYGGMENASNIFYFENSVTGRRGQERLIAHEIAHQWFGNSASEANWHHVWLSEGFATYMTNLYVEQAEGHEAFVALLETQRQQVVSYAKRNLVPIIDTTVTDYNRLLNTNSYQKGGWVLHMLRQEVGDSLFWQGIRTYYARYAGSNALTDDFRVVMETVSGRDLQTFFQQWLYSAGHPKLEVKWRYDAAAGLILGSIRQTQKTPIFEVPLDIAVHQDPASAPQVHTVRLQGAETTFELPAARAPERLLFDPNVRLLFEGK